MTQRLPPEISGAVRYYRLSSDPCEEIPLMRREAARLAELANRLPGIDRPITQSLVNTDPAALDDPGQSCCGFCGQCRLAKAALVCPRVSLRLFWLAAGMIAGYDADWHGG